MVRPPQWLALALAIVWLACPARPDCRGGANLGSAGLVLAVAEAEPVPLGYDALRSTCLELVAANADQILLGTVERHAAPAGEPQSLPASALKLQIHESLKGAQPVEIVFPLNGLQELPHQTVELLNRLPITDVLLFLSRQEDPAGFEPKTADGLYLKDLILFLDDGSSRAAYKSPSGCWSLQLKKLATRAAVLQNVREAVAFSAAAPPAKTLHLAAPLWLHLPVPYEYGKPSPLEEGRIREMTVPLDSRLEQNARLWVQADDLAVQVFGIKALAALEPCTASIAALKGFLNHPYYSPERVTRGQRGWYEPLRWLRGPDVYSYLYWYPLRDYASSALATWGVDFPRPTTFEPIEDPPEPPVPWGGPLLLAGALATGLYLLRRKIRANR